MSPQDGALRYELLVRTGFGAMNGEAIDRYGDPAGLADTDVFSLANMQDGSRSLTKAKVAVSYAMYCVEAAAGKSGKGLGDRQKEFDRLMEKTLAASNTVELSSIVEEFFTLKKALL